jgi:hypothetical protein
VRTARRRGTIIASTRGEDRRVAFAGVSRVKGLKAKGGRALPSRNGRAEVHVHGASR